MIIWLQLQTKDLQLYNILKWEERGRIDGCSRDAISKPWVGEDYNAITDAYTAVYGQDDCGALSTVAG